MARFASVLSEDERERVGRLHFEADRRRAAVAHGALRFILGGCLGRAPESLRFARSETGKPELLGVPGEPPIAFNVSHSGGLVLIGIARGRLIGVDVEQVRENVDVERIAERFFTPDEVAAIRQTPAASRRGAFYSHWTAKEAYLKAIGSGLGGGLGRFSLSPRPGGWTVTPSAGQASSEPVGWSIVALKPKDGYAAAVAVSGGEMELEVVA